MDDSDVCSVASSRANGNCKYCGKFLKNKYQHQKKCKKNPKNQPDEYSDKKIFSSYICLACNTKCASENPRSHKSICQYQDTRPNPWYVIFNTKLHKGLRRKPWIDTGDGNIETSLAKDIHKSISINSDDKESVCTIEDVIDLPLHSPLCLIDSLPIACDINISEDMSIDTLNTLNDQLISELSALSHRDRILHQHITENDNDTKDHEKAIQRKHYFTSRQKIIDDRISSLQSELNMLQSEREFIYKRLDRLDYNIKLYSQDILRIGSVQAELTEVKNRIRSKESLKQEKSAIKVDSTLIDPLTNIIITLQLDPDKRKKLEQLIADNFSSS